MKPTITQLEKEIVHHKCTNNELRGTLRDYIARNSQLESENNQLKEYIALLEKLITIKINLK